MLQNELYYTLALMQVDGVGDVIAKKLIHHCGTAEAIFKTKATTLAKIEGIGKNTLRNLQNESIFQKAEKEILFLEKENLKVLHFQDSEYPTRLKHCFDSPVLLFQSGNIDLSNRKILSIVGTRQITR